MNEDREWLLFESRHDLRAWLEANHEQSAGVWAVYPKSGSASTDLSWSALVEECLCFGWIDSLPGKVDEERTRTYISPRKPGSGWSRRNQLIVDQLVTAGQMHPAGKSVVDEAKADGSWHLFDLAEDLVLPAELEKALAADKAARGGWDAYPERTRKALLQWFYTARREETRERRCEEIVSAARAGVRPKGF